MGIAAAISRVGAAIGTFLLPTSVAQLGVGPTMLIATAILLVGLVISIAWAPETRDLTLVDASTAGARAGSGASGARVTPAGVAASLRAARRTPWP